MDDEDDSKTGLSAVAPYFDLGLRFAIAILIGLGGGYWLDSRLHTMPLFVLIGLILGATSGFVSIYRAVYPNKTQGNGKGER